MCEVGLTLSEISYMLSHVKRFARERTVATPLAQFASRSYVKPSPYGNVLIMSPWNYPFLLTMEPLVDALAAGNTAIVKPSAYSPAASEIIGKIISEIFPPRVRCSCNRRTCREHLSSRCRLRLHLFYREQSRRKGGHAPRSGAPYPGHA